MIPAPVGFQCPECVAGAAAQIRQPTTVAGGALIDRPVVTYALIGINVAVYAGQYLLPTTQGLDPITTSFAMWPPSIAVDGEWWRLGTAAFLHGSPLHLLFNMYVLFALGPTLERILGHYRYTTLYLLAAVGGGIASYAFSPINTLSVGASGAVFGLMGALVVAGRRLRFDITQVLVLTGINIAIGFIPGGNVDWRAHLGGLVTGALVAAIMVFPAPRYRKAAQVGGILLLTLAMLVLVVWRTASLTT